MQRQSLGGSPGSKVQINGGPKDENLDEVEKKRKDGGIVEDEEETKEEKLYNRSISRAEKSIHLIPIIIIFCLLVLYLCSYDPSQKDLLHFDGLRRPSNKIAGNCTVSIFQLEVKGYDGGNGTAWRTVVTTVQAMFGFYLLYVWRKKIG